VKPIAWAKWDTKNSFWPCGSKYHQICKRDFENWSLELPNGHHEIQERDNLKHIQYH